jgi:NADPH:quinone reductase-like Zn-dependent oxidoreductase
MQSTIPLGLSLSPIRKEHANNSGKPPRTEVILEAVKSVVLRHPAAIGSLTVTMLPAPPMPAESEILVRLHASSLNYHDYVVVTGGIPAADGRIPLSDGAGEVVAVGAGVALPVGATVVSTFFPHWADGGPQANAARGVPGDDVDGFAREIHPRSCIRLYPRA